MASIFIFHGTGGYPQENWFPWLAAELQKLGGEVYVPQFPTPDDQRLELWLSVFERYESAVTESTIFIGHSLGGTFLLHLLEKLNIRATAAIFVATSLGIAPLANFETDKLFGDFQFDWMKIRASCKRFLAFHSDNDPLVGIENGKVLAQALGIDLNIIHGAGHFNTDAGYVQFPLLLEKVKILLHE